MTVRIAKPAVNLREKLSELERPIGVNGAALMATNTPQEAFSLIGAGRRNIIINGDMRIAQRGTTSTTDNNYGCVDRWFKYSGGNTSTWGQSTDAVHGTYAYWVADSGGYGNLRQRIEPFFVPTEGLNYTASFWMKISSGTAPLRYEIYNNTDNTTIKTNLNHDTLTTEWKKYTINFRLNSNDSMDNWHIMIGSNGAPASVTFYLTKCQVERGNIATEFEHRLIGEELALCKRYYQRMGDTNTNEITLGGYSVSGTAIYHAITLPVEMRIVPTLTQVGTFYTVRTGQPESLSGHRGRKGFGVAHTTTETGGFIIASSVARYFVLDAEL